jgi:predicted metalloprotease
VELERLTRMFDSRRAFLDDRVARNDRQIARLESIGSEREKRIIPALRGQIDADHKRLAEIEQERRARVEEVQAVIPSHFLQLLGIAMVVRPGRLEEMRA